MGIIVVMKSEDYVKDIADVFTYFSQFSYAPSFDEIHRFLKIPISSKDLQVLLKKMTIQGSVVEKNTPKGKIYTLGEYSRLSFQDSNTKYQSSKLKMRKIRPYVRLLSYFPQIKLIGLSGSVAMMNADTDDDVDLFIITAASRLWTGRAVSNILAVGYGLKRRRVQLRPAKRDFIGGKGVKDKVCLNLFFDEARLSVPHAKKNEYIAHEILQMRPLFVRGESHKRFLSENAWVFKIFPNANRSMPVFLSPSPDLLAPKPVCRQAGRKKTRSSLWIQIGGSVEFLLKKLQLLLINRHKTTEIISANQLWFFPDDFEKKLQDL